VIVLADSTKWGMVGLADFGPLSSADIVITDDALPADARAALEDAVDEVILVAPTSDGT
jgi:DeoR/GlpR family transcriptional regulator of sugar metabolism